MEGDAGGRFGGVAVGAGADGGEGDGVDGVLLGEGKAATVALGEQFGFLVLAALPDGADGVDDPTGGEVVAFGDAGFAGGAAAEGAALGE